MSNLLTLKQSKVLAFALIALAMVVGFAAFNANAAYESLASCPTLRMGSTGSCVMTVQTVVGASADGSFGPMTAAAVTAWQASHGLTADGVVGAMTKAAMMGSTPSTPTPTPSTPSGLTGGAGDVTLNSTSTDVEDTLKEGEEDMKIFGVKVEADGSDVAVTSMKLGFQNCEADAECDAAAATSSENFTKYVDEVTVWMGDEKVGSLDSDDFSRDSGNPDEYSKTVTLSNAVVREDDDQKFYVAVTAAGNIDTDDMADADWSIVLDTMRFVDATGAILTADTADFDEYDENDRFGFEDVSTDDQMDLRSSTGNPDDATVQVEENDTSDEYSALKFKLDVDEDSSDIDVTSIQIDIAVTNYDVDEDADVDANDDGPDTDASIERIIDSIMINEDFEADLDSGTVVVNNGTATATYIAEIDSGDLTVDSGDDMEMEVTITFNDQDGNYNEGVTVQASVANENIDAESSEDEVSVGGTDKTGAVLTLRAGGADFQLTSTQPSSTVSGDNDQNATFKVKFIATAFGDDDIQIPQAGVDAIDFDIVDASDLSVYQDEGDVGTGVSISITDNTSAEDTTDNNDTADAFVVADEETFTVTVTLNNDDVAVPAIGQYYLRINSINFYPNETDAIDSAAVTDFETDTLSVSTT